MLKNLFNKLGIELWFSAHLAYGFVQLVFIPIVMPAFVAERTGSFANAGLAMGFFGVAGLAAPLIGLLADKYKAHRLAQFLGMVAYVIAGFCYIASGTDFTMMSVGSVFFGLGSATLLMLNPVFIAFAGYDNKTEALKLGRMAQAAIIGTLVGGGVLAALTDGGFGYETSFYTMMGTVVVLAVITFLTNKEAGQRVLDTAEARDKAAAKESQEKVNLLRVIFSKFGLFLFAVAALCAGQGAFQAQFPNLMKNAFTVSEAVSATSLSISAVLGLLVVLGAEKFSAKFGPVALFRLCTVASIAVVGALYFIAEFQIIPSIVLPVALVIIYLQGITVTDMCSPAVASRLTRVGAGYTQGLMMFFISIGFATGSAISGFTVESFSWSALPVAIGVLTVVAFLCIWAVTRSDKQADHATTTKHA
ncbi:MFS transporter [Vibrio hangzhouensis]|uniref:Na+/melibiose symporter n=1 Tax=Vibrio hangzhouensis TaxID=462991 RepID=A0A1H5YWK6_9VIBR|nr:MFS transporter [Vibrio hangzhouensis]SEG27586.1 Na+/melibiose symporter [Vibrio hangzhouensis]